MANTVRDVTSRMILGNIDIPLIIVMRPNPVKFTKDSEKVINTSQTIGAWINEHWGNKQDIIYCEGFTRAKIGNNESGDVFKPLQSITESNTNIIKNTILPYNSDTYGPKQFAEVDRTILKLEQLYKLDKERISSLVKAFSGIKNISDIANRRRRITADKIQSLQNLSQSFIIYRFAIYLGFFTSFSYVEDFEDPRRYSYNFKFTVTFNSIDFVTQSLLNNFPESRALKLFQQGTDVLSTAGTLITRADKLLKGAFF